jgi:hypothetical protein
MLVGWKICSTFHLILQHYFEKMKEIEEEMKENEEKKKENESVK